MTALIFERISDRLKEVNMIATKSSYSCNHVRKKGKKNANEVYNKVIESAESTLPDGQAIHPQFHLAYVCRNHGHRSETDASQPAL